MKKGIVFLVLLITIALIITSCSGGNSEVAVALATSISQQMQKATDEASRQTATFQLRLTIENVQTETLRIPNTSTATQIIIVLPKITKTLTLTPSLTIPIFTATLTPTPTLSLTPSITPSPVPVIPNAPSDVTINSCCQFGEKTHTVTWVDNSYNETGFLLQLTVDAGGQAGCSSDGFTRTLTDRAKMNEKKHTFFDGGYDFSHNMDCSCRVKVYAYNQAGKSAPARGNGKCWSDFR